MKQSFRQKTGKQSYLWGIWAEEFAVLLLRIKGYRILGQRIKTPSGDIDILAARKNILVVVEVKKRGNDFAAASAIAHSQQQRLIAAAQHMQQHHRGYEALRFDAVLFAPKALPKHIENAFF